VLTASDSSRSYSDRKPGGVASLGAEGAAAWHGGWPKEEAATAMHAAKQAASAQHSKHHLGVRRKRDVEGG
jgi:hypothetical protein